MIKKIIIFIVIVAAIWAWPAGRAKLLQIIAPVTSHFGPAGERLALPMKKYAAKTQVASILRAIDRAREEGKELPDSRTWVRWLRAHPPSDKKEIDPWGTPFYFHMENRVYTIGSAGPDGIRFNADDIANTVTF